MTDFEYWCSLDEETRAELEAITDKKELEDRFWKKLEFGTGGMRGIMGAGPNRMNIYTVAKATKGLADYLKASKKNPSAAIAFDSRNNSGKFAEISAQVLAAEGIRVYLFDKLMPTPVLSYAVRYLKCDGGIVITASHNPKEYNGYKVYDADGCQLTPADADKLIGYVNAVESFDEIKTISLSEAEKKGLFSYIDESLLDSFINECKAISLYEEKSDLKIVYTPLHGTGNIPVRRILADYDVTVVSEQENPDGDFSTVRSPNPEEKDALTLAIKKAGEIGADIVIGTDPDCDRVGIAVKCGEGYRLMTGNQTGALLMDFILRFRALPENPAVVKTIVTSEIGAAIARKRGCEVIQTLTGFKYIGDKICKWEKNGGHSYVFGYEESYGYLAGTHARDKDAVSSSMLIAEMAAYHKSQGRTLVDALNGIYAEYGYYYDCLETVVLKGKEGAEKIRSAMDTFRNKGTSLFADLGELSDYSLGIGDLPEENVLRFNFTDGSWAAVRPSGTEPKLKMYYSVKGDSEEKAIARQKKISEVFYTYI